MYTDMKLTEWVILILTIVDALIIWVLQVMDQKR
jgi:hypothetical protein